MRPLREVPTFIRSTLHSTPFSLQRTARTRIVNGGEHGYLMYRERIIYIIVFASIAAIFAAGYFLNDNSLPKIPPPTEMVGYIGLGVVALLILVACVWAYRETDSVLLPVVIIGAAVAFAAIPKLQEMWKTIPKPPGPSLEPVKDVHKDKWTYCEANECHPLRFEELSLERVAFIVLRTKSDLIIEWNRTGKQYWRVGSTSGKAKFYRGRNGLYFGAVQSSNQEQWGAFYIAKVGSIKEPRHELMAVAETHLEEWESCDSGGCIPVKMEVLTPDRLVYTGRTPYMRAGRQQSYFTKYVWNRDGKQHWYSLTYKGKGGRLELRKIGPEHYIGTQYDNQSDFTLSFELTRKEPP